MLTPLANLSGAVLGAEFLLLHFIPGFEEFDAWAASLFPVFPTNENLPLYQPQADTVVHLASAAVASLFVVLLAVLTRMSWAKAENAAVPAGRFSVSNVIETILDGCIGLGEQVFGSREKALRYLPLIGTLALFIFFCNALALVPGMAPPTDALSLTLAPALVVFVLTHYHGLRENGMHHITHFFGPMLLSGPFRPWWLLVGPFVVAFHLLFLCIEIISHCARPVSLALRLMGNMTGDHKVFVVFLGFAAWPLIYPVPIYFLATIVVTVQTVVFAVLSMVYISMAIEHSEEAH